MNCKNRIVPANGRIRDKREQPEQGLHRADALRSPLAFFGRAPQHRARAADLHGDTRGLDPLFLAAGVTSARDLGTWLSLNLNGGRIDGKRILSEESVRAMQTMQSKFPKTQGSIRQRKGFGLGWFLGNYRVDAYTFVDHGGAYIGTAAHVSFIPERRIGVGILANSSPGGLAICDIISIDIYDHMLGLEGRDLLPRYSERIKAALAENKRHTGPNPAKCDGLSLPPGDYVGRYVDETWGTVEIALRAGNLVAHCGDLRLVLHSTGKDRFDGVIVPGMVSQGRFEFDGDRVEAVIIETSDDAVEGRFVRVRGDR